jgi:hypothetical protein
MSHLKSSKKTLTNTDYIHNIKNSTIRENIYNNCNNNYKLCNNTLLNSKNFDLYMSVVKGESEINPLNQDIKLITTNSDEYPFNYVTYSNEPREEIIQRSPCCKPLTVDKNYIKNGNYKKECGFYNQCSCDYSPRSICECNNNQRVIPKLSTPKIYMNSTLKLYNHI